MLRENRQEGMLMPASVTGGCACGAIRYEFSADPLFAVNCYCRDCQRSSGAAMASIMALPKTALKILQGEARQYEVTGGSGKKVGRGFCATCGSPMFTTLEASPDIVGVKVASLDDPNQFKPVMSIYMSSAPSWAPISDHLPKFPKMPG
jgi:hypothetical protein